MFIFMKKLENLGLSAKKLDGLSAQELAHYFLNTKPKEKEKRKGVLKSIYRKDVEFQNSFYTFSTNPDLMYTRKF